MDSRLDRMLRVVKNSGIGLEYDASLATTATTRNLRNEHLTIVLGKMFIEATDAQRAYLIAHELSHIARGDLLVRNVNPEMWNIASDDCIHHHLSNTELAHDVPGAGFVTHENLVQAFPKLADVTPTRAVPIYRVLMEQLESDEGEGEGEEGTGDRKGCGFEPMQDLKGKDRAAAARAQGRLVANEEWQTEAQSAGKGEVLLPPNRCEARVKIDNRLADFMRNLRLQARRGRGIYQRVRSWSREGRTECLPGRMRRPVSRVVVAVDVSGSMTPLQEKIIQLVTGIERDHEVIWVAWATNAARVRNSTECYSAEVGGGTRFTPALALAESFQPDALLVISDAILEESSFPPHMVPTYPTIWAIIGSDRDAPFGDTHKLDERC